jgi:hypothetical protein
MKLCLLGLIACGIGASAVLLAVEATPPTNDADNEAALMRAKLASAQKIVEGLMVQDFKLVRNGAQELEKICDATQWHAEEDEVYAHYRTELKRTARKLTLLSQGEDRDAAAYTYMHSITTCINCHDYCRDVLRVARDELNLEKIPPQDADDERPSTNIRR